MTREEQAVEKGAALLDKFVPGWESRIETRRLDVSDSCDCILGQLFSSFYRVPAQEIIAEGLRQYGGDKFASDFGFDRASLVAGTMETAWINLIEKRRGQQ